MASSTLCSLPRFAMGTRLSGEECCSHHKALSDMNACCLRSHLGSAMGTGPPACEMHLAVHMLRIQSRSS
jgi:hypothetical protein